MRLKGEMDPVDNEIRLDPNMIKSQQEQIFIHEIIEALKPIIKEDTALENRVNFLIKILKFIINVRCTEKTENTAGFKVILEPVTCGSKENEEFFKWTPYGKIDIGTINPEAAKQFIPGEEYYIDFSPAKEPEIAPQTVECCKIEDYDYGNCAASE
jgi:hypothetical protein